MAKQIIHNITQWRGSSYYNNDILGVQFKSKSLGASFWAPHCYIMKVRGMKVEPLSMLCVFSVVLMNEVQIRKDSNNRLWTLSSLNCG